MKHDRQDSSLLDLLSFDVWYCNLVWEINYKSKIKRLADVLLVSSILCVLSLTACGNRSNTPKCVDKDVQEEVANFMKEKTKQEITRNHVAKIDKHENMGLSSEARKVMELFLKKTSVKLEKKYDRKSR